MNQRPSQLTRFRVMAAMALVVLAIYLVVLFNTQVVHHEEYLAKSIQTITWKMWRPPGASSPTAPAGPL